jgi:L-2,4-diaminobutyrate decarboxylase
MENGEEKHGSDATAEQLVEDFCNSFLRARSRARQSNIINVADEKEVAAIRALATPTAQGQPTGQTIHDMLRIMSNSVVMDHPGFFGFIPSPVDDTSLLGDIISTMFNAHAGSWLQSSGPSAVEDTILKWLAQKAGFPATAGGVFVSGGSIANLTAIVAARDAKLTFEQRTKAVIYLSEETHSSVQKGLGIAGFHKSQTRRIECDESFRLSPRSLREAIAADRQAGLVPFLIVATCGLTNTGGVDPLHAIADVAGAEDLWLHVDGAYGASVLLSNEHKHLAEGVGRAHSLSWDAHKWLFQTYACGVILVRDVRHLYQSFATSASYIQDANEATATDVNFWSRGVELTRPVRAMKLWFTLQTLGLDRMGALIDHGIRLAETAEQAFRQLDNWKVVTPAQLAIVNFAFVASLTTSAGEVVEDLSLSERVNVEISKRAILRNIAAPLTTRLRGKLNLRMCTISPALSPERLLEIVNALDSLATEILAEFEKCSGTLTSGG